MPTTEINTLHPLVFLVIFVFCDCDNKSDVSLFFLLRSEKQRQYLADQGESPLQGDLKPLGITFCPTEYESENLTKHGEACLFHSQTDTLLSHKQPSFFFYSYLCLRMFDTTTSSSKTERGVGFFLFHDKDRGKGKR